MAVSYTGVAVTRCIVVLVVTVFALALDACVTSAVDYPVSAKKLSIKSKNGKQKLVLVIKDAGVGFPEALSVDDPRAVSMDLELFSGSGDHGTLSMPDSGWDLRKDSWLFQNRQAPAGISPVRAVRLTKGKRLKIVSRGAGLLPTGSIQWAALRLVSGNVRTCVVFDESTVRHDDVFRFSARRADSSNLPDCSDDSLGVRCTFNAVTWDCVGTCSGSAVCALTDPLGQVCSCVDPADSCGGTAPVCNGTCSAGETCTSFGSAITPSCGCIPDGATVCGGTPGVCGGTCPLGKVCATVFDLPSLGGDSFCTCGAPGDCGTTGVECAPGFGCALIPPGTTLCAPVGCPGSWSYPTCGGDCGVGATCTPVDVIGFKTCVCSPAAIGCAACAESSSGLHGLKCVLPVSAFAELMGWTPPVTLSAA